MIKKINCAGFICLKIVFLVDTHSVGFVQKNKVCQ